MPTPVLVDRRGKFSPGRAAFYDDVFRTTVDVLLGVDGAVSFDEATAAAAGVAAAMLTERERVRRNRSFRAARTDRDRYAIERLMAAIQSACAESEEDLARHAFRETDLPPAAKREPATLRDHMVGAIAQELAHWVDDDGHPLASGAVQELAYAYAEAMRAARGGKPETVSGRDVAALEVLRVAVHVMVEGDGSPRPAAEVARYAYDSADAKTVW